ncbi:NADP-dependent oxidoreductase [Nocardia sp. NPDC048505]|uniref:NADP-dependent oxidoreductase n=1 Tax=unclassified Nocardia TaxID=2637762 RepID=UPI0033E8A4D3
MQAIAFDGFGGPEVLRIREVPIPEPTGAEVRVAVRAAAVNPSDWKIRCGALSFGDDCFPQFPGWEIAGVVDALGPEAHGLAIGDPVFGWTRAGGYAEYALSRSLARKPEELSWTAAAALPIAVNTAVKALDLLELQRGETLLINGASGAVGSMAAQLAVAAGVTVVGTAAAGNQELVRSFGAAATTYGPGLADRVWALAPRGVDAVLDVAQHGGLGAAIALRGGADRIVALADFSAAQLGVTSAAPHGIDAVFDAVQRGKAATGPGRLGARPPAVVDFSAAWLGVTDVCGLTGPGVVRLAGQVAELVCRGVLRLPGPARSFPLAQAARAHHEMEHGHGPGKVVLVLDQ